MLETEAFGIQRQTPDFTPELRDRVEQSTWRLSSLTRLLHTLTSTSREPSSSLVPVALYPATHTVIMVCLHLGSRLHNINVTDACHLRDSPPNSSSVRGTPSSRTRLARAKTRSSPLVRSGCQNGVQSASGRWVSFCSL